MQDTVAIHRIDLREIVNREWVLNREMHKANDCEIVLNITVFKLRYTQSN